MARKYSQTGSNHWGFSKKGPDTFEDHETGAEHPAHLDEVEDDLPLSVPVTLAPANPAKRLTRETRRDEVGPNSPSPLGPELDGVTLRRVPMGGAMGRIVGFDRNPLYVASPGRGGSCSSWAATVKPPIPHARSAWVQGMHLPPGLPVFQASPDGATWT